MSEDREGYIKFLEGLELEHFTPEEIVSVMGAAHHNKASKAFGLNRLPPKSLWKNIAPTLRVVDRARRALGKPIVATSIYRSPSYNRAIGGASSSLHMQNKAMDLIPQGATPKQLHRVLLGLRDSGVFKGGLGLYSGFVHVDTRGNNADWVG